MDGDAIISNIRKETSLGILKMGEGKDLLNIRFVDFDVIIQNQMEASRNS